MKKNDKGLLLGEAIRTKRLSLHLTQRDLANLASTTPATICHIERDARKPSAELLSRISAALECSMDELITGIMDIRLDDSYINRVVMAMKVLPPSSQEEVVKFCEYLRHRHSKSDTDS